ncbi:unnamed protein product [Miscanthus lutarioriparius]|uniref:F-box domain-containing protein n=1 Tax=Miscanthus lutarioriparius TaxID=422564 RepID=A0A811Q8X6_9POAL|nr:unnamed protein product [Miscanthus lutarioriparius]
MKAPTTRLARRPFAELPTDVLFTVLLLLSAKELCRLRVVCRAWRSVTCDPHFIRAHAARHQRDLVLVARFLSGPSEERTMLIDLIDQLGKTVKRVASAMDRRQVLTLGGSRRRAWWRDMQSPDMFVCPDSSVVVDGVVYLLRNGVYNGMAALPSAGIVVPPADCVASFDLEREEWRKRLQGPISMGYDDDEDSNDELHPLTIAGANLLWLSSKAL